MRLLLLALALGILAACAFGQEFVHGEVLVRFRSGYENRSRAANHLGLRVIQTLSGVDVDRMSMPPGLAMADALRRLRSDPAVLYAEPNYVLRVFDVNDSYYTSQWDLKRIAAPAAWRICTGSPEVLVAVLDTGADLVHPDLAGKIVDDFNFVGIGPAYDGNGHGTHTAGTVAAVTNNNFDVASLGYDTRLLIGKVASDSGSGTVATVAQGIAWAANNGARVITMSLGVTAFSTTLRDAVDDAWNRGIVVVAAAGNYGGTDRVYPAAYDHCIAVAATDELDRRCSFSSYGSWVHVAAPGKNILSLYRNHGTALMSGTSMAAPHVAALAALLWANGGRGNASIRTAIENSGDPTTGFADFPARRINARRALLRFP